MHIQSINATEVSAPANATSSPVRLPASPVNNVAARLTRVEGFFRLSEGCQRGLVDGGLRTCVFPLCDRNKYGSSYFSALEVHCVHCSCRADADCGCNLVKVG